MSLFEFPFLSSVQTSTPLTRSIDGEIYSEVITPQTKTPTTLKEYLRKQEKIF
ncbi:hypothetical protein EDC24_1623 [Aquisalibacillus elongatus]|uniref:Uncharacterized protein n=1 Tax=Aquisalibacillus elongatus TaxID=485577 RepID=A0A3N5BAB9_9BACI|nr:hypothetical protein EDC24_1623 [Aquisalibacillus elongatus]